MPAKQIVALQGFQNLAQHRAPEFLGSIVHGLATSGDVLRHAFVQSAILKLRALLVGSCSFAAGERLRWDGTGLRGGCDHGSHRSRVVHDVIHSQADPMQLLSTIP